jgi:hypothetical protein
LPLQIGHQEGNKDVLHPVSAILLKIVIQVIGEPWPPSDAPSHPDVRYMTCLANAC